MLSASALTLFVGCAAIPNDSTGTNHSTYGAEAEKRLQALELRVQQQEDREAIRRVAYSYGYFMDNALIPQVIDLFASNMDYGEISGYGLYRGRAGCETIWRDVIGPGLSNQRGERRFGMLVKHYLLKDIITIAADGQSAQARFDYLGFSGAFGVSNRAFNQLGVYRMGLVKEEGIWKIKHFNLHFDTSDFHGNTWTISPGIRCPRANVAPPDEAHVFYYPFPEAGTVPFHFSHPVSGEAIPAPVNPLRYWQGNREGEFFGDCGKRENAVETIERDVGSGVRTER